MQQSAFKKGAFGLKMLALILASVFISGKHDQTVFIVILRKLPSCSYSISASFRWIISSKFSKMTEITLLISRIDFVILFR